MSQNRALLSLTLLLAVSAGCSARPMSVQSQYGPGQVWRYNSREGEEQSRILVCKIENLPRLGVVVHVALDGLNMRTAPGKVAHTVAHMPFTAAALTRALRHGWMTRLPPTAARATRCGARRTRRARRGHSAFPSQRPSMPWKSRSSRPIGRAEMRLANTALQLTGSHSALAGS